MISLNRALADLVRQKEISLRGNGLFGKSAGVEKSGDVVKINNLKKRYDRRWKKRR